jgi:hypothetical protein
VGYIAVTDEWLAKEAARLILNIFRPQRWSLTIRKDSSRNVTIVEIADVWVEIPWSSAAVFYAQGTDEAREWLLTNIVLPQLLPHGF